MMNLYFCSAFYKGIEYTQLFVNNMYSPSMEEMLLHIILLIK